MEVELQRLDSDVLHRSDDGLKKAEIKMIQIQCLK